MVLLFFLGCDSINYTNDTCPFEIEWQNTYAEGFGTSITVSSDGGYAIAGQSTTHNATLVIKLDHDGKIEWQKNIDGHNVVNGESSSGCGTKSGQILATPDDGFIVVGFKQYDYCLVKLNSVGEIEWEIDSIGGSNIDYATSMVITSDGAFVIAGQSYSNDGDITNLANEWFIESNGWVVKINSSGEIIWDILLRSEDYETINSIIQAPDGGFAIAGESKNKNFWVVKLDSLGTLEWEKIFDNFNNSTTYSEAMSIVNTIDGGYAVAGFISEGNFDYRVMKLNSIGEITWDNRFGGIGYDLANSIIATSDGGIMVAGRANSVDGDISKSHCQEFGGWDDDYWIIKLNSYGELEWDKSLGGTSLDEAFTIIPTLDDGLIVAGYTSSYDFDVLGNTNIDADYSFWVVKLKE